MQSTDGFPDRCKGYVDHVIWSTRLVGESSPIGSLVVVPMMMGRRRHLEKKTEYWSGKRDLNPRPSPWQGDALPLSYSRSIAVGQKREILLMHERNCQAVCRAATRPDSTG